MVSRQFLLALTSVRKKKSKMIHVKRAYASSLSDTLLKSILVTLSTKLDEPG
jgi:hypothetical protein